MPHVPNYWWVNHTQTFAAEIGDGYLWSPKVDKNGNVNQTYLNMTRAEIDDVVFSFARGAIRAVGIVTGYYRDMARPLAFGTVGQQWDNDGWLVPVRWHRLDRAFVPKSEIYAIAPLLPSKYSPIQANGNGNQKFYLTAIDPVLGELLIEFVGFRVDSIFTDDIFESRENLQLTNIEQQPLPQTEKQQLVKARVGQGIFRYRVLKREGACRLTGVSEPGLLIASHIKPWCEASNSERLDGDNGILLSPHADRLFDSGRMGFESDGTVICRDDHTMSIMQTWGLDIKRNAGIFTDRQKQYLGYHRAHLLHSAA